MRKIGYKAFDQHWKCRDFQYVVGATYEMEGKPVLCESGFHYCKDIHNLHKYYNVENPSLVKFAVVEDLGDTVTDGTKSVTNKIRILQELPYAKVMQLSNRGSSNYAQENFGDHNLGSYNHGSWNRGNGNFGDDNMGDWNSGDTNLGDHNEGTGNMGSFNSGNFNIGAHNEGNCNDGNHNVGGYNRGDYNIGYWNVGSNCHGLLNTKSSTELMMFDHRLPDIGDVKIQNRYLVNHTTMGFSVIAAVPKFLACYSPSLRLTRVLEVGDNVRLWPHLCHSEWRPRRFVERNENLLQDTHKVLWHVVQRAPGKTRDGYLDNLIDELVKFRTYRYFDADIFEYTTNITVEQLDDAIARLKTKQAQQ